MSVTIKELASMLKISPATVSLALNGDQRVAAKTAKKIKKLAKELNYIPNNFGRGLQSHRSRLVGYLLGGVTSSFYNELLQGVGEACVKAQYGLLTGIINKKLDSIQEQINLFLEKNIDGLILSIEISEDIVSLLESQNIPYVFCSRLPPAQITDAICVKNDDYLGGRLAAEHLVKLGHRFFACCSFGGGRTEGNLTVLRENSFPEPILFSKAVELEEIMKKPKRPTAIIAYSDLQAIKIMHIMTKLGLKVPQDVSIIGTDDLWFAALPEFSFTSVALPRKSIGEVSVKLLLDKINGKETKSIFLAPELVVRNSTAAPAEKL
jgi:LacI family transcriptional regulator, galactose operon repressor